MTIYIEAVAEGVVVAMTKVDPEEDFRSAYSELSIHAAQKVWSIDSDKFQTGEIDPKSRLSMRLDTNRPSGFVDSLASKNGSDQ